jgi:hypothetical protein
MASLANPAVRSLAESSRLHRLRRYLAAADRSQRYVLLSSLGIAVTVLLASAAAMYVAQAVLAIVAGRHLFGDGSWFLVKMLSENHVAIWNPRGWHDFYYGRLGAFTYEEYPTLLASRLLHVRNPKSLALIYGVTLFSFKPLSIVLCYHFARDKRLVIFPLLTLFAVTMNCEVYLISETHLLTAAFWAALFGLMCRRKFTSLDLAAMVIVSAPLLLCYETMVIYGLFLCSACVYRFLVIAKDRRERWLCWGFFVWYSMGVLFAALATVFPRDRTQRAGFLSNMLFIFHWDHIGARVSCIVLVLCLAILLVPERYKKTLNTLVAISVLCSLAIPAYIIRWPHLTDFAIQIIARTMHASLLMVLTALFLAVYFHFFEVGMEKYKRIFAMVAVLGTCQSCWSMIATTQWSDMLTVLRSELRTHSGPVPFEDSVLSRYLLNGQPMVNLHAQWPLMSLSILYSDQRTVQTIVLGPGVFQPFDPYDPASLPNLKRFGVSYQPYLAALPSNRRYELGQWISFGEQGNSRAFKVRGWWDPDPWGTWTTEEFAVSVDSSQKVSSDLLLEVRAGAFVNEKNPDIEVTVLVNNVPAGEWSYKLNQTAGPCETRRLVLNKEALDRAYPPVILFLISGAHAPKELGLSADQRRLGLAVCQMRLLPLPADYTGQSPQRPATTSPRPSS